MGSPSAGCSTPPDHSATRSDELQVARLHESTVDASGQGLGQPGGCASNRGDDHHFDRRVQLPQDGEGALAERAGRRKRAALLPCFGGMAGDSME